MAANHPCRPSPPGSINNMTTSVGIGSARARGRVNGLPPQSSAVSNRRPFMRPPTETPRHVVVVPPPPPPPPPPSEVIEENQGVPDELYEASIKTRLEIVEVEDNPPKFYPHTSAWKPRKAFENKVTVGATVWSKVTQNSKNFYYAEFAKKYKWRKSEDAQYRAVWEIMAADRYSDWIYKLKKFVWMEGKDKPETISSDTWDSFIAHWQNPKTQAIAAQNAANRRGGEADGVAPSTHTGGSKPHFVHTIDKTIDGVAAKHIDMYKALHQSNDEPCNEKVKAVLEAFDKKKSEEAALTSQSPLIDDNKRFLDVLEPRKKGRRAAVRTGSSLTPLGGIPRFASTMSFPPNHVSDDSQVVERVVEIMQTRLNSSIRNVVLEMIGDTTIEDCVGEPNENTTYEGDEGTTGIVDGEGSNHGMDAEIEPRVGVDDDQFMDNLLS